MQRIMTEITGATAAAIADCTNSLLLEQSGDADFDALASGILALYRSKRRIAHALQSSEQLESFWVNLHSQTHLFYPVPQQPQLFVYLALDRRSSVPEQAMRQLQIILASAQF